MTTDASLGPWVDQNPAGDSSGENAIEVLWQLVEPDDLIGRYLDLWWAEVGGDAVPQVDAVV